MLVGTADIATLARTAPTIPSWGDAPIVFEDVQCLQLVMELRKDAREALLPPALHPTIPASLSIQALKVARSPWGAFSAVICRISCRSGVRARGFTTGVIADASAVGPLRERLGFPAVAGEVGMTVGYAATDLIVRLDGLTVLSLAALDPEPMANDDVQYTGTLNLAHTKNGLRLVQVEADHAAMRVERLSARLDHFVGEAFGNSLLSPYRVVAASIATETVTFPPIRFVCKPDELAFTGTETIA